MKLIRKVSAKPAVLLGAVVIALLAGANAGAASRAACPPGYVCKPAPPPKVLVLNVKNPACCGDYACVKVCVPACCEGAPTVCSRCGILGRGIVTYQWCCGHHVTVVFTAFGGVRVH
jgi:hypothetical protein